MKKLNNKGFTLIELLAVVVILAVVMGIAMTSVLSAMNKSRGGSLADSASVIANAFNQKYTESLVGGVPTDIYGAIGTYNFSASATYYIIDGLADTFGISTSGYAMASSEAFTEPTDGVVNSFVNFNATTGKFIVCMFANTSGSYYVDSFKTSAKGAIGTLTNGGTAINAAASTMYACSDGTKSWT